MIFDARAIPTPFTAKRDSTASDSLPLSTKSNTFRVSSKTLFLSRNGNLSKPPHDHVERFKVNAARVLDSRKYDRF